MLTEHDANQMALDIIEKRLTLARLKREQKEIALQIKNVKGKLNWQEKTLLDWIETEGETKKVTPEFTFYSILKPIPEVKILKGVEHFPEKYRWYPAVSKTKILKSFYSERMEDLETLVEIKERSKYLRIDKKEDGTVNYTRTKTNRSLRK